MSGRRVRAMLLAGLRGRRCGGTAGAARPGPRRRGDGPRGPRRRWRPAGWCRRLDGNGGGTTPSRARRGVSRAADLTRLDRADACRANASTIPRNAWFGRCASTFSVTRYLRRVARLRPSWHAAEPTPRSGLPRPDRAPHRAGRAGRGARPTRHSPTAHGGPEVPWPCARNIFPRNTAKAFHRTFATTRVAIRPAPNARETPAFTVSMRGNAPSRGSAAAQSCRRC